MLRLSTNTYSSDWADEEKIRGSDDKDLEGTPQRNAGDRLSRSAASKPPRSQSELRQRFLQILTTMQNHINFNHRALPDAVFTSPLLGNYLLGTTQQRCSLFRQLQHQDGNEARPTVSTPR